MIKPSQYSQILVVLLTCLPACQVGTSRCCAQIVDAAITSTKESLESLIHSYRAPGDGGTPILDFAKLSAIDRYRVNAYQCGLTALERTRVVGFEHPKVLAAVFQQTETIPLELFLIWLSSAEEAQGTFIQTAQGKVIASSKLFVIVDPIACEGEKGLLRYGFARISDDGEKQVPHLQLDTKAFHQDLQVGIIDKNGHSTKPIKAFIEETLRMDSDPKKD
jgi:hypothetical protein